MMKTFNLRIGNIEIRDVDSEHYDYEVIKWSLNPLYGMKEEYREESPLGEVVYRKNGCTYSESCFEHPETCYVVSFIRYNVPEGWWEVEEVGIRPWELNDDDYADWTALMKICLTSNILPKPNEDEEVD